MSSTQQSEAMLCAKHIAMHVSDPRRGFGLDIRFIDHLQIITTSNYNSLTVLHYT
jgi:hypothetical protein